MIILESFPFTSETPKKVLKIAFQWKERKGNYLFSFKYYKLVIYILNSDGDILNSASLIKEEATVKAMLQCRRLA